MRKLRQTSKVKMGEGGVKSMRSKDRGTLNVYMCTQRGMWEDRKIGHKIRTYEVYGAKFFVH